MELAVGGIEKRYGKTQVLKGATYTFRRGKIYGLLGRNGAGKTTLMNCLAGGAAIDGGRAEIIGDDGGMRPIEYKDVGFVFTQPQLPEFMTGHEFVKYFLEVNRKEPGGKSDIDAYFDRVNFGEADRHRLIKEYSHGMKNKVQILAFLILRPPIILLDEPLTSFDVVAALEIKNLIKSLKSEHIIIFSTHILQLARDMCDEIVILNNGVLEKVESDMLDDGKFEQQIVALLKEGEGGA